jgi:cobalt-zinc-cadmium efflux system protein
MKGDKRILMAFILNVSFSIFELFGGVVTNSISIISDAVHDFGDAISIGISYFLEKISKRGVDDKYTYGYIRYSVLGALMTNIILMVGSIFVGVGAVNRLINPVSINYDGMIIFAIFGVIVNFLAVYFTKGGSSLNQRAVNLHMLEDVFGWLIVLVGAFLIKFTGINRIDAILSISVALFILINAIKGLKKIVDLFLAKTPNNVDIDKLREHLLKIKEIKGVHHIHIWSIDGVNNFATLHVVINSKDSDKVRLLVKDELKKCGINHSTVEIENSNYKCDDVNCHIEYEEDCGHHHHHH